MAPVTQWVKEPPTISIAYILPLYPSFISMMCWWWCQASPSPTRLWWSVMAAVCDGLWWQPQQQPQPLLPRQHDWSEYTCTRPSHPPNQVTHTLPYSPHWCHRQPDYNNRTSHHNHLTNHYLGWKAWNTQLLSTGPSGTWFNMYMMCFLYIWYPIVGITVGRHPQHSHRWLRGYNGGIANTIRCR